MSREEQEAFKQGYRAFQIRRGVNPFISPSLEWKAYENGWCQAFIDNAPDLSHEEVKRRVTSSSVGWFPAYKKALEDSMCEKCSTRLNQYRQCPKCNQDPYKR